VRVLFLIRKRARTVTVGARHAPKVELLAHNSFYEMSKKSYDDLRETIDLDSEEDSESGDSSALDSHSVDSSALEAMEGHLSVTCSHLRRKK